VSRLKTWLPIFGSLWILGCVAHQLAPQSNESGPKKFHRVEGAGIENFYCLGSDLYSGAAPEGDIGFATLQKLGVKSIITVDGAVPQVELALKYGLRYVHIPVGYDGIVRSNALAIIKAAETLPGPLFVHCHHGLHRGAAAAAIICEGLKGWTPHQAEAWLHSAGTDTNYSGLYRTVRDFVPPNEAELRDVPETFASKVETSDLVKTMVQIDEHFGLLQALQKKSFKPLPEHPDATPASESLLLFELFREARRMKLGRERARLDPSGSCCDAATARRVRSAEGGESAVESPDQVKGEGFLHELARAEKTAQELHSRLKDLETKAHNGSAFGDMAFHNMKNSCVACHKLYRN